MVEKRNGIGKRLGDTIRHAAAIQAKAYQDYGELLARYARRDISTLDLTRNSADIYVGAAGAIASAAINLGRQTLEGGSDGLKAAARDANRAVGQLTAAQAPAKRRAPAKAKKAA